MGISHREHRERHNYTPGQFLSSARSGRLYSSLYGVES